MSRELVLRPQQIPQLDKAAHKSCHADVGPDNPADATTPLSTAAAAATNVMRNSIPCRPDLGGGQLADSQIRNP